MTSCRFPLVLALFLAVLVSIVLRSESLALPITNRCPQNVGPHDWPTFYAHEDYCTKYYMCVHGNPQQMDCAPGTVFNEQLNTCVHAGGMHDTCYASQVVRECERGTVDLIPDRLNCHHYYDCSSTSSQFYRNPMVFPIPYNPLGLYGRECRYPDLFDIHRKQCVPYDQAVCGQGRVVPTWECHYIAHVCKRVHCQPCVSRYPSCVNRADGLWPSSSNYKWSSYYVECQNQRTKNGAEQCASHELIGYQRFHADKRRCVSLWEIPVEHGGYEPSCDGKDGGYYISDAEEKVTYSCPDKNLFYCNPPLLVDSDINHCIPFHNNAA